LAPGAGRSCRPRAALAKRDGRRRLCSTIGPVERKWWTLIVVCTATFMLLLDITIVNVALPSIAKQLHASFSQIQWVIDAYSLTLASALLTAGALADLFGRRLIFSIGLGLFSFTSLLCALSPSADFLIAARAGQGIGGSIMFATALALLVQEFHGKERGMALGVWGATIAAAAAIGPLIGGVLTSWLGWSSIFYINVPIGIVACALTLMKVAESRNPEGTRVDWIGTVTFTTALFLLVYAIIESNTIGWGSTEMLLLLAGSAVAFADLFKKPAFLGASLVAFSMSASMFAMFLYFTLYMQTDLGLSPLQTGLRFLPTTIVSFFVAAASGNLTSRVPVRLLMGVGLGLVAIGLLIMRGLTVESSWTALLPGFIVAGAGIGLTNPALASTAVGVVPPQRAGMASGINNTFRQVGIATGIAALGALFQSTISRRLAPQLAGTAAAGHASSIARAVAAGGSQRVLAQVPAQQRAAATNAIHVSFVAAMNNLVLVSGIVALIGCVLALALVRGSDFVAYHTPEAAAAGA
jgi:EmrB/QacA subfamily drug resistance transporter